MRLTDAILLPVRCTASAECGLRQAVRGSAQFVIRDFLALSNHKSKRFGVNPPFPAGALWIR